MPNKQPIYSHLDELATAEYTTTVAGYSQRVVAEGINEFHPQKLQLGNISIWINGSSIPYPENQKYMAEARKMLIKNRAYWTSYR